MRLIEARIQRIIVEYSRSQKLKAITENNHLDNYFSKNLRLVLGCQRSGTTLLYLMLTAHKKLTGLDENFTGHQIAHWPLVFFNILRNRRTVLKLPKESWSVELISKNFSRSKIVWMVRHPFSVVSSMRNLDMNGQNWIQSKGLWEAENICNYFPDKQMKDFKIMSEIELGANIWKYKNLMRHQYQNKTLQLMEVQFENLVSQPRKQMGEVLKFLELRFSESVLQHEKTHGGIVHAGGTKGDKAIDVSRAAPKLSLTTEDTEMITSICHEEMQEFGYSSEFLASDKTN